MEVPEKVRTVLGTVVMPGQLGQGSEALPEVLSTKVLVLLRCGGVAGTLSISSSGVTALSLPLTSLSASSQSLSLLWAAVNHGALALP
jgi:hypothetical protein